MDAGVEAHTGTIECNYCKTCNPWVLCSCYVCEKQWWCRVACAQRWCDQCMERELHTVRVLIAAGHENIDSEKYHLATADWVRLVYARARTILVVKLECSKDNPVPAIWTVPETEWEKMKRRCLPRFGKRQGCQQPSRYG